MDILTAREIVIALILVALSVGPDTVIIAIAELPVPHAILMIRV